MTKWANGFIPDNNDAENEKGNKMSIKSQRDKKLINVN